MLKDPFVRSKLISSPTNFNHLVHVGPTDGKPLATVSAFGEAEPISDHLSLSNQSQASLFTVGPPYSFCSRSPVPGSQPFTLPLLDRLPKRKAEAAAVQAHSDPIASPRPHGARLPWAVKGSQRAQTPVRTSLSCPCHPTPCPSPDLLSPDLNLRFYPLVLPRSSETEALDVSVQ